MNDLDRKIQAALRRDSAGASLADEPNLAEEVLAAFRGRHWWPSALVVVAQFAALIGLVLTVVRFYHATRRNGPAALGRTLPRSLPGVLHDQNLVLARTAFEPGNAGSEAR
jgi:hypothetical protein